MIPEVEQILNSIREIHSKKNEDYAAQEKQFENFERSNLLASWFDDQSHKSFVVMIGTKLARLATLLNSKKEPNNESIEDSFLDLCTYCILWWGFVKRNKAVKYEMLNNTIELKQPVKTLEDYYKTYLEGTNKEVGERLINKAVELIESNKPKYQCTNCGAQFDYAPHIIDDHSGSKFQQYYFDSHQCKTTWLSKNQINLIS